MIKEVVNARKQNMRLYSFYRSISLDLLFFYAIEFIFLTQVKKITPSEVVLSTSFYAIFMIFLQIPASIIVDKVGARKCTIVANIFNAIYVLLIIFICNNIKDLIFAQLISAMCYSLKDISDDMLLTQSIPETSKKGEIFSKLEGKGFRNYYIVDSIGAILSGSMYVINPYAPIIISLIFVIIATIISFGFKDIEKNKIKHAEVKIENKRHYFKELKDAMKFIIKSQRLRSLFVYTGISWGIFALMGTYRSSILVDIGVPTQMITVIAAIVGIAASLGSKGQLAFNKRFKNKSLTIILLSVTTAIIIAGLTVVLNIQYVISIIIISLCFIIISVDKGMSLVLSSRYLGNFSSDKILSQIYAVNAISKNIFRALIGFVGSYLLDITTTANSMIIVGLFMIIISISLIGYMKTRLGLKPEQYGKEEIYNKI